MFIIEVIYATTIFFSNPINLFPVYESLYTTKFFRNAVENFKITGKKLYLFKFFLRIMIILICFGICFFIPDFIKFISLMGSALFPIIGLYIPVS